MDDEAMVEFDSLVIHVDGIDGRGAPMPGLVTLRLTLIKDGVELMHTFPKTLTEGDRMTWKGLSGSVPVTIQDVH